MTAPSAVSVSLHWGAANIWVVSGQREFCCSADLRREPASGPGAAGENAIDYIDDDYVDVDGRVVPTVLEVARLISSAMDGCGIVDADILHLSHPSDWGAPRRRRLLDAARRVAHDVVLVPTSIAAARSAHTAWRSRCVVLELRGGTVVASVVAEVDGELRIDGTQSSEIADVAGLFSAIGDLSVRDAVVLVGPSSHAVAASLERGSTNVHGHASIRILDESRGGCVSGGSSDARSPDNRAGQFGTNRRQFGFWRRVGRRYGWREVDSFLGLECLFAASSRRVARRPSMVRGGACGGRRRRCGRRNGRGVHSRSKRFSVDGVGHSHGGRRSRDRGGVERAGNACTEDFDLVDRVRGHAGTYSCGRGSVAAEVPSDWKLLSRGTSSGRTDLVPGSGADRKIVVIEKRLAEGVGFDSVEAVLRQQFSTFEDPLRFAEFAVLDDAAGKRAVVYVEFPDDFSEVRWRVYVDNGRQVSIGCQYLIGEWGSLEADCLRMWQSVEFTP